MASYETDFSSSYSPVDAGGQEHEETTQFGPEMDHEKEQNVTPLQNILEQKDLDAAAACLAFANMLESTGSTEQAEFFYAQMRSIIAQYVLLLGQGEPPKK